jgi:GTP-binding protein LepA
VSAKSGEGINELLDKIVERIPAPKGDREGALQALIFDAWFDSYVGVIVLVRVKNGVLRKGDKIRFMATGGTYDVLKLGVFAPEAVERPELGAGEVGYIIASIKTLADAKVGDTVTHERHLAPSALPGFKDVKPMVFSGIFPTDSDDYADLRDALRSSSSTTPASVGSPRPPTRWASASAAVFSASCTWRLSTIASSGSTTSTSSRPRPPSCTRS